MAAERGPRRWILLRGLGREAGHWGAFAPALSRALQGAEVSALDLPGAGSKFRETAPLKLEAYAARLMKEAGGGDRVGLVSLSLGAMVALEWAARYPDTVSRLVVINTSLGSQAMPWERFTPEACRRAFGVVLARGVEARERGILRLTSNSELIREGAFADWVRIARERPVSLANYARQIAAASVARPDLSKVKAPGLVVGSRGDRLVRLACSERLARRLGWPLVVHETGGHDLTLDDPEWCAARIGEWAKQI